MLPRIQGEGRLTRDPELRFIPSGAAVASFGLAFNDRRKNEQTQQWEDGETTFLDCTVWRDQAENVAESLHKGDLVFVEGKISMRKYTNKEGVEVTAYGVTADNIGPSLRWNKATVVAKAQREAQQAPQAAQGSPWDTMARPPAQEPVPPAQAQEAAPGSYYANQQQQAPPGYATGGPVTPTQAPAWGGGQYGEPPF